MMFPNSEVTLLSMRTLMRAMEEAAELLERNGPKLEESLRSGLPVRFELYPGDKDVKPEPKWLARHYEELPNTPVRLRAFLNRIMPKANLPHLEFTSYTTCTEEQVFTFSVAAA